MVNPKRICFIDWCVLEPPIDLLCLVLGQDTIKVSYRRANCFIHEKVVSVFLFDILSSSSTGFEDVRGPTLDSVSGRTDGGIVVGSIALSTVPYLVLVGDQDTDIPVQNSTVESH